MGWRRRREERRHRRVLSQMDRASRRLERVGRRRSNERGLIGLAVMVALALAGVSALHSVEWDLAALTNPRVYVEVDGRALAVPRAQASEGRLLLPVEVTTSGSHAFLHVTDDGRPVGYDPCRPVTYVIRPDGMPAGGAGLVEDAAAIVSAASGVLLTSAGTTDESPRLDRLLIQPERYGDRWAPVLVAWSDATEMPELAGQVAGVGGSAAVPGADGSGLWLAAGRVVLDGPDIAELLNRADGYEKARAIVVHELAHVLGLDHVDDPGELMHPVTASRTDLGPGDRQGLALLGQAPCEE